MKNTAQVLCGCKTFSVWRVGASQQKNIPEDFAPQGETAHFGDDAGAIYNMTYEITSLDSNKFTLN